MVSHRDSRVREEPSLSSPYIHKNNKPKYHALLVRAVEAAKRCSEGPKQIIWVAVQDTPHNTKETPEFKKHWGEKKRSRFLQFHDQKTRGVPGLLPWYVGLQARVTEKMGIGKSTEKSPTSLKHIPCKVTGWDLHVADRLRTDDSERCLD